MSSNKFQEVTINGNKYGLHLLGALKAARIGKKLFKVAAPVIGSYVDANTSNALAGMKFSTIATLLAENVDELELEELIDAVIGGGNLTKNGQALPASIDEEFKGNLGEFMDVVSWAFEVNFKSLFLDSTWGRKLMELKQKFISQKEAESEPEQSEKPA